MKMYFLLLLVTTVGISLCMQLVFAFLRAISLKNTALSILCFNVLIVLCALTLGMTAALMLGEVAEERWVVFPALLSSGIGVMFLEKFLWGRIRKKGALRYSQGL